MFGHQISNSEKVFGSRTSEPAALGRGLMDSHYDQVMKARESADADAHAAVLRVLDHPRPGGLRGVARAARLRASSSCPRASSPRRWTWTSSTTSPRAGGAAGWRGWRTQPGAQRVRAALRDRREGLAHHPAQGGRGHRACAWSARCACAWTARRSRPPRSPPSRAAPAAATGRSARASSRRWCAARERGAAGGLRRAAATRARRRARHGSRFDRLALERSDSSRDEARARPTAGAG